MILKTKRLILRPPKKSDWKDILEGVNDLDVAKNLLKVSYPYKKKDAKSFINDTLKEWRKKEQKDYTFFIELKSEKKVIGSTGIHSVKKENGTATTGSWINKKYWKKGYITEAKIPILDFAFNKLNLRRLETEAFEENKASNNMSKKLGYVYEGKKRKGAKAKADGKIHDVSIYGLLKEEWKRRRLKIVKEMNNRLKKDSQRKIY